MQIRLIAHKPGMSLALTSHLMTSAFPVFERRSSVQLDAALAAPDFELLHIEAKEEDHQEEDQGNGAWREVGFVALWHLSSVDYIEHLAVDDSLRGKGVGSRALTTLFADRPEDAKPVVLEIDPRVTPIEVRRAHFYERLGFVVNPQSHRHPPYRLDVAAHELELLSLGRMLTDIEHGAFVKDLESRVMNIAPDRG